MMSWNTGVGRAVFQPGLEQDALPFLLRAADTASGDLDELERIAGLMLKIGYVRWGVDIAERVLDSDSDRAEA